MSEPPVRGAILPIAVTVLVACSHGAKPSAEAAIPVRTAPVVRRVIASPLELSGNVVAAKSVQLAATVPGRLIELRVRIGDRVTAGEPLATIGDSTYRARRAQAAGELARAQADRGVASAGYDAAEARLELARVTEARMARLYAAGGVARQTYDQAHSEYLAAAAGVEQAKGAIDEGIGAQAAAAGALDAASASLADTVIRAPFDGIVTAKLADPGSVVAPGVPIIGIQSDGALEIDVAVPQDAATAVAVGKQLQVRVDALDGRAVDARVRSITPMNDPATRSVLVKVVLPPVRGIMSGMYVRLDLPGPAHRGVAVPLAALVTRAGQSGVFVVHEGQATFVPVRTGSADARFVRVDGLRSTDRQVVVSGTDRLTDASAVTVRQ